MNEIIYWLANNNTLMIQSGFTIVLLLAVIYVYQIFFVTDADRPTDAAHSSNSSKEIEELNKKIMILLQQKNDVSKVSAQALSAEPMSLSNQKSESTAVSTQDSVSQAAAVSSQVQTLTTEAEQMRSEIARLKQQLNESEKKIFEMTPATTSNVSTSSANIVEESGSKVVVEELNKKIQSLEARLSEYDIISEDIAELSQLRAENAEMKKRLGANTATNKDASSVEAASATTPTAASSTAAVLSIDTSAIDSQITEVEKNLMSEFEKSTKKG